MSFGTELLGWTGEAVDRIRELRGWDPAALERLELRYLGDEHRVGIPLRDERGDELGELRYDPTGRARAKMLAPRGVERQLFPPPELIGNEEVAGALWLVEGEPDAIRLWSLGIPAVAVPGAQNWQDRWAPRFTGQGWTIVVCFDCDEPGRANAHRAARAILEAGGDVRLLDLDPGRNDGYDLTDFVAPDVDVRLARRLLEEIAGDLELYRPETGPEPDTAAGPGPEHEGRPWSSVTWAEFRDQAPPAQTWLVDGLLPAGALVFVAGPPKRGKTWFGIGLAISIALGRPFLGFPVPEPSPVLYAALEGSQTGLRTRIGALARGAGADPDTGALDQLRMLYRPRPFDLADLANAAWLVDEANETAARLVVIDVLRAAARFQENVAEDFARIRDHLEPLLAADRTVMLLHHFGKLTDTQKERSPGERMAGTGAMYGALDVGFLITRSEDGARRLRVDVEARDFAAPDALGLVIHGEGSGQHGGFAYTDTAELLLDAAAAEGRDLIAEAEAELELEELGLAGDELAATLKIGRKELERAVAAEVEHRTQLGQPPRVRRWDPDADGRFPGRKYNSRPYLTAAAYDHAREQLAAGRLDLENQLAGHLHAFEPPDPEGAE